MNGPADIGPRPELRWLPVDSLTVDHRYQRTLESRRSQTLVDNIAARFRWSAFQAILAAPATGKKGWLVLDGQHRVEAARRIGIKEVPAVIVAASSLAEQAAAFVRANTDRVAVNNFALHHARLAAGDPGAEAVDRLCRASGISIPKYPIPADKLKPGQTLALTTIARLPAKFGDDVALVGMKVVASAFAGRSGALRASTIHAVTLTLAGMAASERAAAGEKIAEFLRKISDADLSVKLIRRRQSYGGTEVTCLAAIIKDGIRHTAATMAPGDGFIKSPTRQQLMGAR